VGSFVADVVGDDGVLYEIQTGGFRAIRRKLEHLVDDHQVVLVHPIASRRMIVKMPAAADAEPTRQPCA